MKFDYRFLRLSYSYLPHLAILYFKVQYYSPTLRMLYNVYYYITHFGHITNIMEKKIENMDFYFRNK